MPRLLEPVGRRRGLRRWSPAFARRRHDRWSRRVATKFANGLRRALLHDECPDTGCGLKAFGRDVFLRLPGFEGMHRFLPALFQAYGHPLVCCSVTTGRGSPGRSKYTQFRPRRGRPGRPARGDLAAAADAAAPPRRRGMSSAGAGRSRGSSVSAAGAAVGWPSSCRVRPSLPPLDRDKARYMQATAQMFETGNFVDIRFQDQPR